MLASSIDQTRTFALSLSFTSAWQCYLDTCLVVTLPVSLQKVWVKDALLAMYGRTVNEQAPPSSKCMSFQQLTQQSSFTS
eukprot:5706880-Amphidinium_carterae.1